MNFPNSYLLKMFFGIFLTSVISLSSALPLSPPPDETVYITSGQDVLMCNVYESSGMVIDSNYCSETANTDPSGKPVIFSRPAGIAVSAYYAYISDLDNPAYVTKCKLAFSDSGNFPYSCIQNKVDGLNTPINIMTYPDGSGNTPHFLYVLNQFSGEPFSQQQISVCFIDSIDGSLLNCRYTASGNWSDGPLSGITFTGPIGPDNLAYVYIGLGKVTKKCRMDQNEGLLSKCEITDSADLGQRGGIDAAWARRHEHQHPVITAVGYDNNYGELSFSTLNSDGSLEFKEQKPILDTNGLQAKQPGNISVVVAHPLNELPRTYIFLADSSNTLWTCTTQQETHLRLNCINSGVGAFPDTRDLVTRMVYP